MIIKFTDGVSMQDTIKTLITEDLISHGNTGINRVLRAFDARVLSLTETGGIPTLVIESSKELLLG